MSTAPFDKYLASVKSGDSESDKMRALLRAYPSLGKGFTRIAKQDDVEEEPPREDEDPDAAVESEEAADADDSPVSARERFRSSYMVIESVLVGKKIPPAIRYLARLSKLRDGLPVRRKPLISRPLSSSAG